MYKAGDKIGLWTVVREASQRNLLRYWLCERQCGSRREVYQGSLRKGVSVSCGCLPKSKPTLKLEGETFGRWTVLKEAGKRNNNARYWLCQCGCGTVREVCQSSLRDGQSPSCGCITKDRMSNHGLYKKKEFKVWSGILNRCNNKTHKSYENYGGRGIKVCDRWANSFSEFIKDMGFRPGKNFDIDRIDNDGDYEPKNCRWVRRSSNLQNKRTKSATGYKGVNLRESGSFVAVIGVNKKALYLGSFASAEEAAETYDKAAIKYYGSQAWLNFPENRKAYLC